jgi:predicted RNA-binding protein associated with RNAse of E/G family
MGLLREIVLLPLAPVRGVMWTARQVLEVAEHEEANAIRHDLIELEQALRDGLITEEEFDEREDELIDQLDQIYLRENGAK